MKLPEAIRPAPRKVQGEPSNLENVLMVQRAQSQALNAVAGAAMTYKTARDNAKLSSALTAGVTEYEKLVTYLANKEAIDLTGDDYVTPELRDSIYKQLDIDPSTAADKDGRVFVPAYEVRGAIHDHHLKNLKETGRKFLGSDKGLIEKYNQALARNTNKGANELLALNLKQEREEMSATGDIFYQQAVQAGDALLAYDIIENMANSGAWEPNKVAEHVNAVQGDVQYSTAIKDMMTGDAMDVRAVQAALADPNNKMTDTQRWDVYKKADQLLEQKKAAREEVVKKTSRETLGDGLFRLGSQGVMPWQDLAEYKKTLEPSDYITLVNAQRAIKNSSSSTRDNPQIYARLASEVARLSVDNGVPRNIRRQTVVDELHKAMGWNQETQTYTGAPELTAPSYFRLLNEVNQSEERTISDPQLDLQIDKVYRQLTGAGRDMVAKLTGDDTNLIAASEYEYDITKAKLEQGEGFDIQAWHDANWRNYATKGITDGRKNFLKNRLINYAVTLSGAEADRTNLKDNLNHQATIKEIKDAFKEGSLTEEYTIELINYVESGGYIN